MGIAEWAKNIRDVIGTDLVVMVAGSAIVSHENGNILLQKRSDNARWGLPGGGIDPGEEPAQAAIREVYEETGLKVKVSRLVGIFGGKDQVKSYPNGDQIAYVAITFECHVIGGTINPDPDESLDVRWFQPDQLPDHFTEVHRRRIAAWQNNTMPYFEAPTKPEFGAQSNYVQSIRRKIGNMMIMMAGTVALVFDNDGQLLVQKRADTAQWGLPGGCYEAGEEPAETIIREVYEETGLQVKPTRLVGVYGGEKNIYTYPNGDIAAFTDIVFVCEIIAGKLSSHNRESDDLAFVSPDNLPAPFIEKHKIWIDHALNQTQAYFVR